LPAQQCIAGQITSRPCRTTHIIPLRFTPFLASISFQRISLLDTKALHDSPAHILRLTLDSRPNHFTAHHSSPSSHDRSVQPVSPHPSPSLPHTTVQITTRCQCSAAPHYTAKPLHALPTAHRRPRHSGSLLLGSPSHSSTSRLVSRRHFISPPRVSPLAAIPIQRSSRPYSPPPHSTPRRITPCSHNATDRHSPYHPTPRVHHMPAQSVACRFTSVLASNPEHSIAFHSLTARQPQASHFTSG